MNTRILLMVQGLFKDGLSHILTEQPCIEIVGVVNSWKAAHSIVNERKPDIIIVDHNKEELRQTDLAPLLANQSDDIKLICLTLTTNKMVIHNRQFLADASVSDLIHALRISGSEGNAT